MILRDYDELYVAANLRGGQAYAFGEVHGFEHVVDQLRQPFVVGCYFLGCFTEHGVSVKVYGEFHFMIDV